MTEGSIRPGAQCFGGACSLLPIPGGLERGGGVDGIMCANVMALANDGLGVHDHATLRVGADGDPYRVGRLDVS